MTQSRRNTGSSTTKPPRLDRVDPQNLGAGYPGDLGANATVDGLEFGALVLDTFALDYATVSESVFGGVTADEAELRSVRVVDTVLDALNVPVLRAARSTWKDVVVRGSRIGSAELYESGLRALRFENCKLGFVNLRGAHLNDVLFVNCTIDELDLGQATAARVAFDGCTVRALDLQQATVSDFDLRGADVQEIAGIRNLAGVTITQMQLGMLAPALAESIGIRVED
ncbi:pentapeptide repeat-containing protein [Microterricola viridarii]|uniref:Pentapeptide repeat-containing protein n=1 Tax=Microterricola viridarii TaxID=412690 RepID=A0A0Y0N108_9MICO|nr:pentapeptide repeat-containing protein [Microterricola viridarii]AMB57597.1 hypothetical protein AWU67_00550 [Microterricola viridarii]